MTSELDIKNGVFYGFKEPLKTSVIDELIIPEGVTDIEVHETITKKQIGKLVLPSTLHDISVCFAKNIFRDCKIKYLEINSNIEEYVEESLGYEPFVNCEIGEIKYTDKVTEIASIIYNTDIGKVDMADSVLDIRTNSFIWCKIEELKLSNNLHSIGDSAFSFLTGISEIHFPSSLKIIGDGAFYQAKLSNITFEEGLKYIGNEAFSCTSVEKVKLPESLFILPNFVINKHITELTVYEDTLNNLRCIGSKTPDNIELKLKSTILTNKNKNPLPDMYIDGDTLYKVFKNDKNIKIPQHIKHIFDDAFLHYKMNKITLPDNLESIGAYAFEFSSIEKIQLPKKMKRIGTAAFRYTKLKRIEIPQVKRLGESTFGIESLEEVVIPEGITEIGAYCFANSYLKTVKLPNSLKCIRDGAFQYNGLKEITIPENVKYIGDYAFNKNMTIVILNRFKHDKNAFAMLPCTLIIHPNIYKEDKEYFEKFDILPYEESLEELLAQNKSIREINQFFQSGKENELDEEER